jgi:drug/metabolite transporter (DMT)-like permease
MDSPAPPEAASARGVPAPRAHGSRAAAEAYAILAFTMACWGGNAVAGRLSVGEISPMVITALRWGIVSVFLVGVTRGELVAAWPELRRNAVRILFMGTCGFTVFNALFYVAAHYTTAVNISILQGAIPVFVIVGAALFHRVRIGPVRILGTAITLIGVLVVATQGHLATLAAFKLNSGDALMIVACFLYAGYTLALRDRPRMPSTVFFSAMALLAFLTSLPLLAYEVIAGTALWPGMEGWLILLFIALFPSFLAQLGFMRGVAMIGPSRAGLFANLVPIFGALGAVMILGEPFALYHLAALVLVIGGILLAETAGRRGAH